MGPSNDGNNLVGKPAAANFVIKLYEFPSSVMGTYCELIQSATVPTGDRLGESLRAVGEKATVAPCADLMLRGTAQPFAMPPTWANALNAFYSNYKDRCGDEAARPGCPMRCIYVSTNKVVRNALSGFW
ncbi:hypothetical protein HHI36_001928 [Cryptolaemus montrouzieri]|uniref:Uncharacterized protein n=1 Tax=Cryptolaemus montrouzieri TaxID=559131 RepID=A0ABD2P9S9_9CUCU